MRHLTRLLAASLMALSLLFTSAVTAQDNWKSRIVEGAGGVPLVVQEWGNPDGIPVLLVHGFSFGASAFKNQVGAMAEQIRFVAPDLRGHGLSGKPWQPEAYLGTEVWAQDIAAVVEAFSLERPVIVGWSFGGYVTMNYLRHCGSDCASGVILVGSHAGLIQRSPIPSEDNESRPPPRGDTRADSYPEFFEGTEWLARVMTYAPPSDKDMFEKQMTIAMMPPYVRRAMLGLSLDNQDLAATLDLPVLFLHGNKDASVPADAISDAVGALPDAQSLAFADTGHSPFAEQPERFNSAVLEFAQRVYTATDSD